MPFTKSAVELYVSEKAAAITKCGASSMLDRVPEANYWLTNLGVSAVFHDFPPAATRPLVINFVRRIHHSFVAYDQAQLEVATLVADANGRWSPYFAALNNFEVAVAQLYMGVDSLRVQLSTKLFERSDGSILQRLNSIYNSSKHDIAAAELPVWFTNSGIGCKDAFVSFEDLEGFMLEIVEIVRALSDRQVALSVHSKLHANGAPPDQDAL